MSRRVLFALLTSLLLSALGVGLVIVLTGEQESLAQLGSLNASALLFSLGLLALHYISGGMRLALLARLCGVPVSVWRGTRAFILGLFCAAVTPSGGGNAPAIALALRRDGVRSSLAWAITLYTSVLDLLFFAWAIPLAALILYLGGYLPSLWLWLSLLLAPLCLLLWYGLSFKLGRLKRVLLYLFAFPFLKRWQRAAGRFLERFDETAQFIAQQPWRNQFYLQVTTTALHLGLYAIFYAVARDLELNVTLGETLALLLLVSITSYVVPTPGSSGYLEVALTYAFARNADTSLVIPAVLAWRGFSFYLSVVVGALLGGGIFVKEVTKARPIPKEPGSERG